QYGAELVVAMDDGVAQWSAAGEERWRLSLGARPATAPTLHGGLAIVPTRDGWLHAIRSNTGASAFKVEVGAVATPPAAAGGLLLIPVREGEVHAFDLAKREVVWSYDLEGEQWSTPVVWQQYVYVVSWGQRLHCLSLRSGDDVWTRPLPAPVTASPCVAAGALYVVTEGGDLIILDARSGRVLLLDKVANAAIQASPLPLGDRVIVAALDGTVAAYG
ncbi:MAG TPA: PQQ-binding-like beta-propeller repeat protein, partial [Trueperaceae bacterium]|nr:PQQ-binding-like beta-propeller repeat protein [Trueperaceae bacterium]